MPKNSVRSRIATGVAGTAALLCSSACGLLGGPDTPRGELTPVRVGLMPIIDVAPVHMAARKGYFAQEGIAVQIDPIPGGAAGVAKLVNGSLDITFGNWVSFFLAKLRGIDLRLVSDGYQARTRTFPIMVLPDSSIKDVRDLKGSTIALNTLSNITELTARSALEANGIDPKSVTFKEVAPPDMQAALARKAVDAALMLEPFTTQAERSLGVIQVVDTATGPTAEIPIAGYATTERFARENPRAVAAFQRALTRGQLEARHRNEVEQTLPEYAKIDFQTASLVHFGTFPTRLDQTRLERVFSLMKTYGMVRQDQRLDLAAMILPAPS